MSLVEWDIDADAVDDYEQQLRGDDRYGVDQASELGQRYYYLES